MIIEKLELENFRNFIRAKLYFTSNTVFFTGSNGQGKTSLLEAIFYLANLRSFRTSRLDEMKKIGASLFRLSLTFRHSCGWSSVLKLESGSVRRLSIDGVPVNHASNFTGKLKTVAFLPDDPMIVSGRSSLRRRFFDMFISMLDRNYFLALQNYSRALQARNCLLKRGQANPAILHSYSTVLAKFGREIVIQRQKYVSLLSGIMQKLFREIYPVWSGSEIRMKYNRESEDAAAYLSKLEQEGGRDFQRGFTSFGPHLDDFDFVCRNKSLRSYGSRGQCRMTALILKLAELEAVRLIPDALTKTVALVDDAMSDLDGKAREAFLSRIGRAGQTFFAVTEIPPGVDFAHGNRFLIRDGKIVQ